MYNIAKRYARTSFHTHMITKAYGEPAFLSTGTKVLQRHQRNIAMKTMASNQVTKHFTSLTFQVAGTWGLVSTARSVEPSSSRLLGRQHGGTSSTAEETRPPLPPFTHATAIEKVRLAEDGWNTRDAAKVARAYTPDTRWRNRAEFVSNREEAQRFLERKWRRELDYRLIKELWAVDGARLAVRYAYEWRDDSGNWFRSYGNENWEFRADGLMAERHSSINDLPIREEDRKFRWPLGRRPDDHPGLSDLGL